MNTKNLNERLNKINQPMIKGSQIIGKMTVDSAKRMADVQVNLANHMTKNIQVAATNMFAAKSPRDLMSAVKVDGGSHLLQEWQDYQASVQRAMDVYIKEFAQINEEIYECTKDGLNEFIEEVTANSPDGLGMVIKPYQSILNTTLAGMEQFQAFSRNYMEGIDKTIKSNYAMSGGILKGQSSKGKSMSI